MTWLLLLVLPWTDTPGADTLAQGAVGRMEPAAVVQAYPQILAESPAQALRIPCIVPFEDYRATQITSLFANRQHPILKKMRHHNGLDIGCEIQPVVATARGVVARTGHDKGLGRFVKIMHGNGYETTYGHLSEVWVQPGQVLDLGETLGVAGQTGLATGVHLHYEIRKDGRLADPLDYLLLLYENALTLGVK